MTEYLGSEWFRLWGLSIAESKRLGLLISIYDENSYPSGFAGGHVPSLAPDTVGEFVYPEAGTGGLATFAVEKLPDGTVKSATKIARPATGQTAITFRLQHNRATAWNAGFPYVDLTNPNTTPVFIKTTHEAYKEHFGAEFGKTVRWIFTDEPRVTQSDIPGVPGVPLTYYIIAEFKKRCGYDLVDNLPSLFWDTGEFRKVRFDYWQTIHDLFKENYWRPVFQWCERNHMQFTGHAWEHEWPMPFGDPGHASDYAWQHAPGIDWLGLQSNIAALPVHHRRTGERGEPTGPARVLRVVRRGRLGRDVGGFQAARRLADGPRDQFRQRAPGFRDRARGAQTGLSAELHRRFAVVPLLQAPRRSCRTRQLRS